MHLKRWITGLIALPFLIFLVYKGGVLFTILISMAGLVALWEYYRLVFNGEDKPISNIILLWGYGINFAIIWSTFLVGPNLSVSVIGLNLIVVALISLFQFKTDQTVLDVVIKQLQGIIYIPVLLSFLVLIREGSSGMIWVFVLLAVIFAGDTGAYYVGSYLGRHKLSPAVSPGKTIEGSIGGLAVNLVLGGIAKYLFLSGLPWGLSLLFFLAVGIAGQVGDLFESELKRSSGIKDSGGILPGHGGILDRIDALLFASPVAYIFIEYVF
jgi:phosphatidate cytidylyltransferase